jgi:glycosyl transferase family 25
MKIFVTHYTKLKDRKIALEKQFKDHNITDYEFIEKYDREDLTFYEQMLFHPKLPSSVMSLSLKHRHAYRAIRDNYDCALILEDDVILSPNFVAILEGYIKELPTDYDMLFIGDGCNFHIPDEQLEPNKHIYLKENTPTTWGGDGSTKCSDSYIITKACATRICEYVDRLIYKTFLPLDWWLNMVIRECEFKVYWAEPTIVTQGSEGGIYGSSIGYCLN